MIERTVLEHGGCTDAFPIGACPHAVFDLQCRIEFQRYADRRPQVEFGDVEITVVPDVFMRTERGEWRVKGFVRWP